MSETITEEVETVEAVEEKPVATPKRKPRAATKKVAEETAVENVVVEEAPVVTDENQKVITGPKKKSAPRKSNVHSKEDGTLGSHAADSALAKRPEQPNREPKKEVDKVALWSGKNIRWTGVGELSKGYNIVTKEAADKWLTKAGIREATPEEVATHYGK